MSFEKYDLLFTHLLFSFIDGRLPIFYEEDSFPIRWWFHDDERKKCFIMMKGKIEIFNNGSYQSAKHMPSAFFF